MADIIVVKQTVADRVAINQQATEKTAVNPAPVTIIGQTLVPATNATLGGIIVGDNLSITGNGVLSVADTFQPKLANTTYGLTDTGIGTLGETSPYEYYVNGEYVNKGLDKYYLGLRGQKDLETGERYDELYAVGSYRYNANGILTDAASLELEGSRSALVSSSAYGSSYVTAGDASAAMLAANGPIGSSITLSDAKITGRADNAVFELSGKNGGTGSNQENYRLVFGHSTSLSSGMTLEHVARKSLFGFVYTYNISGVDYEMTNGLSFDNTPSLGGFTGTPGTHTSFQHTTDAVISGVRTGTEIRASRNKVELFYLNISPVYTANSILTQGYADTRYQAVGAYLTSANLTYANLTDTPTTLAGYGITDGLTTIDAAATYVTFSEANNAFAARTVSINPGTGLTGGGNLALSRTLSLANTTVTAGSYGSSSLVPVLTVDAQGRLTSVTTVAVSGYTLPAATTSTLGGVRVDGTTITIASGVISAVSSSYTLPMASTTQLGGIKVGSGLSVDQGNGGLNTDVRLTTNTFTGTQNLGGNLLTQAKLQAYRETSTAPTISAGSLTLDLSGSNFFAVSLNAAISTITISNIPSGSVSSFTLEFTGTGTLYSVNWVLSSGVIKWAGAAAAPTITATSGKKDVFCFYTTDGGSNWLGFIGGQNY